MIPEKLHFVRAGRSTRPVTLRLASAAAGLAMFASSQALAQFDTGGYTSSSTPQARAQQTKLQKERAQQEGIVDPNAVATGPIPELQVFAAVSLAETYTSNAAGENGGGASGYDLYTEPGIHLGLTEQSRHLTASINYSLTGQYHARNHDLDQLINQLEAMANAELIEQTLFLDAQASAQPLSLTRTGSLTSLNGTPTDSNYRNSYAYAVRPTLMHQFGNIAEADLWFSQSGVFFVTPSSANTTPLPGFFVPPTNSNTSQIGARISSLDDFVRLRWSLNASASDTYQTAHNSQKVRSATANLSYSLTNSFSVIGTGGYQTYHSSFLLNKDLDGPTLLGGFQFAPSPNFYMYVQAGTQSNYPTYIGALNWNVTPLITVSANASDQVQTPQQQLLGNLQNPGGGIPGSGSGTPSGTGSTPGTTQPGSTGLGSFLGDGLSLDNSVYRYRQYDLVATHTLERTQYSLSAFATLRDRLNDIAFSGLNTHEKNYGLRAGVTRSLRRDLRGSVSFTISKANEFNGSDRLLEADAGVSYQANETLTFNFNTSVLNRDSNNLIGFSNGNLTDVRVTVGVNKSF